MLGRLLLLDLRGGLMGYIQDMLKRTNRNMMILCIVGALGVFVLMALNFRYLANVVLGPQRMGEGNLAAISNADSTFRYYVTVSTSGFMDTGMQYVSRSSKTGSETVKSSYGLIPVGQRALLVKVDGLPPSETTRTFTGALVPITVDEQTEVINKLETEEPSLQGLFLPYKLDTAEFRMVGAGGIAVGLVIYALCGWLSIRTSRRMATPDSHPIMKSLATYGDPAVVAETINAEVNSDLKTFGPLSITQHWLFWPNTFSLRLMRYDDVVWIYKKVTKHRTNGIPTGTSHEAVINSSGGQTWTITSNEAQVNAILESVYARAPWIAVGYAPEILNAWKKDRKTFVSEIERRRQSIPNA
jgi:hypothetical protein